MLSFSVFRSGVAILALVSTCVIVACSSSSAKSTCPGATAGNCPALRDNLPSAATYEPPTCEPSCAPGAIYCTEDVGFTNSVPDGCVLIDFICTPVGSAGADCTVNFCCPPDRDAGTDGG